MTRVVLIRLFPAIAVVAASCMLAGCGTLADMHATGGQVYGGLKYDARRMERLDTHSPCISVRPNFLLFSIETNTDPCIAPFYPIDLLMCLASDTLILPYTAWRGALISGRENRLLWAQLHADTNVVSVTDGRDKASRLAKPYEGVWRADCTLQSGRSVTNGVVTEGWPVLELHLVQNGRSVTGSVMGVKGAGGRRGSISGDAGNLVFHGTMVVWWNDVDVHDAWHNVELRLLPDTHEGIGTANWWLDPITLRRYGIRLHRLQ